MIIKFRQDEQDKKGWVLRVKSIKHKMLSLRPWEFEKFHGFSSSGKGLTPS